MKTLDQFITSKSIPNAWVDEPEFVELYVRIGPRFLDGKIYPKILDLATVGAEFPGNGAFTRLIQRLRSTYPDLGLYVENVFPEFFRRKLERLGFTSAGDARLPSYFWLPKP